MTKEEFFNDFKIKALNNLKYLLVEYYNYFSERKNNLNFLLKNYYNINYQMSYDEYCKYLLFYFKNYINNYIEMQKDNPYYTQKKFLKNFNYNEDLLDKIGEELLIFIKNKFKQKHKKDI